MATDCEECGRPFGMGRRETTSVTGRSICEPCARDLDAAAAGVVAGDAEPVANAISTRGWFRRLRRRAR